MKSLCCQGNAEVTSSIHIGQQSESDAQVHQQVLTSLQQQVQQLSSDVDELAADVKHMTVTYTQVTHTGAAPCMRILLP